MEVDVEWVEMVRQKMQEAGLDAPLCLLPNNVLMLTGYAPVLGNSFVLSPLESELDWAICDSRAIRRVA